MKREKCIQTEKRYLCRDHFIPTDYKYVDSVKLKDNAVPSIFKLPEHMKIGKTRKSTGQTKIRGSFQSAFMFICTSNI